MKNMKNLWKFMAIIMVAMISVGFVSCGDDDDPTSNVTNSLVGTWRKYSTDSNEVPTSELGHVLWVFQADGTMYEHDIDDNSNIIEGTTETFKYKTEDGHLYTQKQKAGREYEWKDEGAYTITNNILEVTKDSGKVKRYQRL